MKKIFIFTLCSLLWPLPSLAEPSFSYSVKECKEWVAQNPTKIEVVYNYGELQYNYDKSPVEIKKIYLEDNPGGKIERIRGLTQLSPRAEVGINPEAVKLESGRYCSYPKEIIVKLSYTPMVYVSNKLEKDSCDFNLTVRHEQTHLDFGHQALKEFAQKINSELPKYIETTGPFVSKDDYEDDVQKVLKTYTEKVSILPRLALKIFMQKI